MKHFFKLSAALAITSLCAAGFDAQAKAPQYRQADNISEIMRGMAPNAGMTLNQRNKKITKINSDLVQKAFPLEAGFAPEEVVEPTTSIGPVERFLDMDGPNGELWYYTSKLTCKYVKHQSETEDYTDVVLTEYEFNIFDNEMKPVGKVHDKMRYRENEVRVPGPALGIDLLPLVTKNFFNNDDKYEIVVSIAVNTANQGQNNYRSVIYSLGGEQELLPVYDPATDTEVEKLCDKPVNEYDAFINDVLDASTDGNEDFYLTFVGYNTPDDLENADEMSGEEAYWELVKSQSMTLNICSKADANGKLTLVKSIEIPYLNLQGNQETSAVAISGVFNGKPYMVVPHYKEPFFNPYYDTTDDISMRENNSLVIDMYELNHKEATLAYHTEIPMKRDVENDAYFTYYGVGNLRWAQDIDFGHFTNDGNPCFYVTRSNFKISLDGETDYSYYVYDSTGALKKTIFEYAESNVELTQVEGSNPLHCFIYYDEEYIYYMVDLYTGLTNKTIAINSMLQSDPDSDPDLMLANLDRVPMGENDWKYCFELKAPTIDEDDNDVLRVAWFDKDGKYERMDYINMGKGVYYAQSLMSGQMLDPKLFKQDDEYEYLVLIKRGIQAGSSESQEELIVAQPQSEANDWKGKTLLYLTPCEKGTMRGINVTPAQDGSMKLMITWLNENDESENSYIADFYDLPFDKSAGITAIEAGASGNISYDGYAVSCPDEDITVYNLQGVVVAKGHSAVETSSLSTGVYMAVAADSSLKFFVKH